jgi:antitoxin component YwqK of YwqJK toxin-antitoxin module
MKPIIIFAMLLCFASGIGAQSNKEVFYAFTKDWTPISNMEKAAYFAHVVKENDTTYVCRYYQKEGPMMKQEVYKDDTYKIPNGVFMYYTPQAKIDSVGTFVNGVKNGTWIHYGDSSRPILRVQYDAGNFVSASDDINKKIYYADGHEETFGSARKKYNDTIKTIVVTLAKLPPQFEGGTKAWQDYLSGNLRTPDRLKNILAAKGGGKATVVVVFDVDKDGNIGNVMIDKSYEWSADMEAMRVIKNSPKWNPAVQNGSIKTYRHKQSLTFAVN